MASLPVQNNPGLVADAFVQIDPVTGAAYGATNPFPMVGAASRASATASIANGASVSAAVDLNTTALLGFVMPAAWTPAALNIEVSADNVTWVTAGVYDSMGVAVSSWASPVAGAGYAVDAVSMLPWRYIRFRSGTAGTPVAQAAQRDFTVITRPIA